MIVPAVIAPDTLSAVRAISISGSIEISNAAIVTGRLPYLSSLMVQTDYACSVSDVFSLA